MAKAMKSVFLLSQFSPYTKGNLIRLYGISYPTLTNYATKTGLVKAGLQVPVGPNEDFDFDHVLMLHFAWLAINKLGYTYRSYQTKVVQRGKAKRFWEVYRQRSGGGSLVDCLETTLLPETEHEGQRQVLEFLIDYIRNKEEQKHGEHSGTSNSTGTRTRAN